MFARDTVLGLNNPNVIPIDTTPNDQTPSLITAVDFAPAPPLPPPLPPPAFPELDLNAVISNPYLSAYGGELTRAATFTFPDAIPADVYSPILFLTSGTEQVPYPNELPSFTWAQTTATGLGATGDVGGVNAAPIPEPLTVCGAALAAGFGGLFKRQLSKK